MPLLLTNEDVKNLLTMNDCIEVLEEAYRELGNGRAVNRPRSQTYVPGSKEGFYHMLKSFDGSIPSMKVSALRLSSDILFGTVVNGKKRREKFPALPGGMFLGLVLLFSTENGELLAIIQDGYIQIMRVGGTSGVAAKYLARRDASLVGLFGSGWQARTQAMALKEVRSLRKIKVYSPNAEHRNSFAKEMEKKIGLEIEPVSRLEDAAKGCDIVSTATNSLDPVIKGEWIEEGMHLTSVGNHELDESSYSRMDVIVARTRTKPSNFYPAEMSDRLPSFVRAYWDGLKLSKELSELSEVVAGKVKGRSNDRQITFYGSVGADGSGGLGIQFAATGLKVYELAKKSGVGRDIPLEWFLQEIHS